MSMSTRLGGGQVGSGVRLYFFLFFLSAFVPGLMAQVPLLGPRGPSGFEERKVGVDEGGTLPRG